MYLVVTVVVLVIVELLYFYVEVHIQKKTKKTSFFCHLFGALFGFAIGLRLYKDEAKYTEVKCKIGRAGSFLSIIGFLFLLLFNLAIHI